MKLSGKMNIPVTLLVLVTMGQPNTALAGHRKDEDAPEKGTIQRAAWDGDLAAVKRMLAANPRLLEESHDSYNTPLCAALSKRHHEVVNFLLSKGANVNAKASGDAGTPLVNAVGAGDMEMANLLIRRGAQVNPHAKIGPLVIAAENGDLTMVKVLMQHGAPPRGWSPYAVQPLNAAVGGRHMDVVRYLLTMKAPINGSPERGSPLESAVARGYMDMAKYLLAHGADPNATPESEDTSGLIQLALANGYPDMAELLVKHGARVDATSKRSHDGLTYLVRLALNDDEEASIKTAAWLINHGANVNYAVPDLNGYRTALGAALKSHHAQIAEFLRAHGALETPVAEPMPTPHGPGFKRANAMSAFRAAEAGDLHALKMKVASGTTLNAVDSAGRTLLHHAAQGGRLGLIKWLIEHGVDINAKDHANATPLDLARAAATHTDRDSDYADVINYLSAHGAYESAAAGR